MKTQRTNNTFGTPNTRANPSVAKKVISATPQARINNIAIHIKYCATNRKYKKLDSSTKKINTKHISTQINSFEIQSNNFEKQSNNFEKQSNSFEMQSNKFEMQSNSFEIKSNDFEIQNNKFEILSNNFETQSNHLAKQTNSFDKQVNFTDKHLISYNIYRKLRLLTTKKQFIMTRKQEAYNSMAHKTIGEMNRHSDIWKSNKVISSTVEKINGLFKKIDETNARQNITTKGITQKKREYRKQLDTTTDVFLGIFRSYAKTTENEDLYANSDKTISEIKKVKDTEITVLVNTTIKYAKKNQKTLKDYGITTDMISDYETSLVGFEEYLSKPQEIKAEKKTATAELKQLFKDLDEQLTEYLDNHMMQYKLKEPQFYSDYENARIIYDDPTIAKSIMGKVTDADTGEALEYVKVTVKFKAGSELADKVKSTSHIGNFQFKGIPEGKCTVTFEKNYYQTLTVDSEVHNNAMTRLNVQLKKNE